jgi:hypothetical protein
MREHVTEFMRMTRTMLLEVAQQRGRPFMLAARVPQTLDGCHADGFDVKAWAEQKLVDVLTLGSRTMDVDVEGIRAAVGADIQLQPCFDDHHATDGYRYAPIEYVRGVFANHFQRGANSVVTFNWSMATPDLAKTVGGEIAPLTHQIAFKEIGDPNTLAGKDKAFAVERRGGYPWADGFFNRNDSAPLPLKLDHTAKLTLHVSDVPSAKTKLTLRCILFEASETDTFEILCQRHAREDQHYRPDVERSANLLPQAATRLRWQRDLQDQPESAVAAHRRHRAERCVEDRSQRSEPSHHLIAGKSRAVGKSGGVSELCGCLSRIGIR